MELKLSRRQRQEERSFSIHDAEAGSSKRGSEERKCFRGRWRSEEKRREAKSREERREGEAERSSSRGRGDKKLVKGVFFCVF